MLSCSDFAKHALKLELYPKQAEILDSFFKQSPLRDGRLVASLVVLVCSMSLRLQWMEMRTAAARAFMTHFRQQ
jgi:hypothetical protein